LAEILPVGYSKKESKGIAVNLFQHALSLYGLDNGIKKIKIRRGSF
jgi:hypothetical protein